jgi:hypothetical protein
MHHLFRKGLLVGAALKQGQSRESEQQSCYENRADYCVVSNREGAGEAAAAAYEYAPPE